jgi:hypothetical protein
MLREGNEIKWNLEAKKSFEYIKVDLNKSPVLASPGFMKDFLLFSFASEHTIDRYFCRRMNKILRNP